MIKITAMATICPIDSYFYFVHAPGAAKFYIFGADSMKYLSRVISIIIFIQFVLR